MLLPHSVHYCKGLDGIEPKWTHVLVLLLGSIEADVNPLPVNVSKPHSTGKDGVRGLEASLHHIASPTKAYIAVDITARGLVHHLQSR